MLGSQSSSALVALREKEQALVDKWGVLATELQGMLRNLGDLDEHGLQDEVAVLNAQLADMVRDIDGESAKTLGVLADHLLAQHQLLFDDPQAATVAQSMADDEQKADGVWVGAVGEERATHLARQWCILLRDIAARQRTLLELLKLDPTRKVTELQQALRTVIEDLAVNRAEQAKHSND